MKMFADQGVDGEAAEHFVQDIYKECNRLGFTPGNIVAHIEDLTKFSKDVRLPEIEEYINEKILQKKQLDEKVRQLISDLAALELKKSKLEGEYDLLLWKSKRAEDEMKSYFGDKQELENQGISITDDIPNFVSTIRCIAEYGYDPQRVIKEFNDIQYHQEKLRALKIAGDEKEKEIDKKQMDLERLHQQYSILGQNINLHSNILNVYDDINNRGFDIEKLKQLHETILKIAESNQISTLNAIDKFFEDIETQYNAKLGFEAENDRLNTQIQILKDKQKNELEKLRDFPFVGPIIVRLIQIGLTGDDILETSKVLLSIFKGPYSVKNIALGMIETIHAMSVNRTRTVIDNKAIEILAKTREELSKLD